MMEQDFDHFSGDLSHFIDYYRVYFDVGRVAVVWATCVMISIVSMIVYRAAESSEFSQHVDEKNDKLPWEHFRTELNNNEQRDVIMMDYRQSARALHTAAERCYLKKNVMKCITIVSKYPPLVNVRCPITGLTPFHRVCSRRNSCLISFMLSHGADPSITTTSHENALCLLIRSYLQAPSNTDFSCLKILQESGCVLDRTDKWYKIFLESATLTANKTLTLWILDHSFTKIQKQPSFP